MAFGQTEAFSEQAYPTYSFMDNDADALIERDELYHLADLMGLSVLNMPYESLSNHTHSVINPMSVYQQSLIDDCHKPFWQEIKQGKYSDNFLSP